MGWGWGWGEGPWEFGSISLGRRIFLGLFDKVRTVQHGDTCVDLSRAPSHCCGSVRNSDHVIRS